MSRWRDFHWNGITNSGVDKMNSDSHNTWRSRLCSLIDIDYGNFRGLARLILGELEYLSGRLEVFVRLQPDDVHRLVFVCLGNINRSAFAGVLARHLGVRSISIGLSTTTGATAFEKAIAAAPIYGIDLSNHQATDFEDYAFAMGDLLLVMEVRHAHALIRRGIPAQSIALLGHWSHPHRIHVHDPHQLSDRYFRTCFAILYSAVANLVDELRRTNSPCLH